MSDTHRAYDIWEKLGLVKVMTEDELRQFANDSIPFLLVQRQKLGNEAIRYRTALEQIAAIPPGAELWQATGVARQALDGAGGEE